MSLRMYAGEYMISPVPVHFGLNWCTHGCFYCFANLNHPSRRAEYNDIGRLLKWSISDKPLDRMPIEWWYLSRGYPMLVSNDSDPFARSNKDAFLALFEAAQDAGVRLSYQTKGGDKEAQDIAISGPKTMFYITLSSDNDDFLRSAEPGAPRFGERLDLIRQCVDAGHHVVVGLNPLVPAWWRDAERAIGMMYDAGVRHAWAGDLHFSRFQVAAMPQSHKDRFSEWVSYGMKRKHGDEDAYDACIAYAEAIGINVFNGVAGSTLGFWRPYFDLGFPFLPTLDGLFDRLTQIGGGKPVAFPFDAFDAWANVGAPEHSIHKEYLMSFGRSLRNDGPEPKPRTLREVHEWYWRWLDYPTRLRCKELCIACHGDNIITDDLGRPIMIYVPQGTDELVWPMSEATYVEKIERR